MLAPPRAAAGTPAAPNEAFTFTPPIVFAQGEPGELVRASVRVQNQTRVDARFEATVFDADHGSDGDRVIDFLPVGDARRGAGGWVEPRPARLPIEAGEEATVELRVRIPEDAGAGGHYAGLAFVATPTRPQGMFELDARSEVPVFVTVAGEAQRDLRVRVRPEERWRWRGGRATWHVELHNAGDVHEVIEAAALRVDGVLGGSRSLSLRPAILLPGERRTQSISAELRDAPDAWSATALLELDDRDDRLRASSRLVWILPWWLLALVVVAVAIIAWRLRARGDRPDDVPWDPSDDAG